MFSLLEIIAIFGIAWKVAVLAITYWVVSDYRRHKRMNRYL